MTEQEMFGLLVECLPSQLDVITVKLKLNQAFLPGSGEPVASRAAAIMKLVRGGGAGGRAARVWGWPAPPLAVTLFPKRSAFFLALGGGPPPPGGEMLLEGA